MAATTEPEHLFLRACRRLPVPRTPIWMMRQAGRYLPQYRAVRAKASFLELCHTPELACEVTLQPIDEFGFDAAILFSDILVPLPAMGLEVSFPEKGPQITHPVRDRAGIDALVVPYAVEGKGSKDYPNTRKLLFGDPTAAHALLDKLARTVAACLEAQIAAGADAVQIFDSWAGILSPRDFREFALRWSQRVIELLRQSPTFGKNPVPIIYFANGCAPYLDDYASSGADVLGVDWRIDIDKVRARVGDGVALQGNMDPGALFLPPDQIRERVADVLRRAGPVGHIFNLGHGVMPETNPEHVRAMVQAVRETSSRP
jgi:uroporphyrinogen decarboxylase